MTSKELTQALKSPAHKLAIKAVELIKSNGPLSELKSLIEQGCPDFYYERDSLHPRSRFYTNMILDVCFESGFGVVNQEKNESVHTFVLGDYHHSEGREAYFSLLLDAGFRPGRNGWRGDLFPHILNSCFYYAEKEKEIADRDRAKVFAKILIASGRYDIQKYVARRYEWLGFVENVDFLIGLGANPSGPDMINCALSYIGCDPSRGQTVSGRADVIRKLLSLGAVPDKNPLQSYKDNFIRHALESNGLLESIASFGVIDLEPHAGYSDFLKNLSPRDRIAA